MPPVGHFYPREISGIRPGAVGDFRASNRVALAREKSGMSVQGMNHFTVLSDDLEATRKFYCDLLGFEVGPRPNFQFPGYWLWVGDQPILHVIHRKQLNEVRAGVIDHMAFTATDLPATVAKLEKAKI